MNSNPLLTKFTWNGLGKINVSGWLIPLLNKPPNNIPDLEGDEDEEIAQEKFMERVASLISNLAGRTSSGPITRQWHFPTSGKHIHIHEPSYAEADIGALTWGSGRILAELVDRKVLLLNGANTVLELGCGTALGGLRVGLEFLDEGYNNQIILTDYHESVVANAQRNIDLNDAGSVATVTKLDWRYCLKPSLQSLSTLFNNPDSEFDEIQSQRTHFTEFVTSLLTTKSITPKHDPLDGDVLFDTIIAADCIFDPSHAELVPLVTYQYLCRESTGMYCARGKAYFVLPLRAKYANDIACFESNMGRLFSCLKREEVVKEGDEWAYMYYVYEKKDVFVN